MSSHSVVIHLHSIACKSLCECIMIGNNSCSLPLQVVLLPNCSMLLAAQLVCLQDSRFLVLLPCKQSCVCVMYVKCLVCQVSCVSSVMCVSTKTVHISLKAWYTQHAHLVIS